MTFRLSKTRTFTSPVHVGTEEFTATFLALSDKELEPFDGPGAETQKDFLRHVVTALTDLLGEDDTPLVFSREVLEDMITYPDLRVAMLRAYNDGLYRARAGN